MTLAERQTHDYGRWSTFAVVIEPKKASGCRTHREALNTFGLVLSVMGTQPYERQIPAALDEHSFEQVWEQVAKVPEDAKMLLDARHTTWASPYCAVKARRRSSRSSEPGVRCHSAAGFFRITLSSSARSAFAASLSSFAGMSRSMATQSCLSRGA